MTNGSLVVPQIPASGLLTAHCVLKSLPTAPGTFVRNTIQAIFKKTGERWRITFELEGEKDVGILLRFSIPFFEKFLKTILGKIYLTFLVQKKHVTFLAESCSEFPGRRNLQQQVQLWMVCCHCTWHREICVWAL